MLRSTKTLRFRSNCRCGEQKIHREESQTASKRVVAVDDLKSMGAETELCKGEGERTLLQPSLQ